jgi:hypothetical protein
MYNIKKVKKVCMHKTYITVLVVGDGIRAGTKSDSQLFTTLGKGTFDRNDH